MFKNPLIHKLKIFIEGDGSNKSLISESERLEYMKELCKKLPIKLSSFEYLEDFLISDANRPIRVFLLKYLLENYPKEVKKPLNYIFKTELNFVKFLFQHPNEEFHISHLLNDDLFKFCFKEREELIQHKISVINKEHYLTDRRNLCAIAKKDKITLSYKLLKRSISYGTIRERGRIRIDDDYLIPLSSKLSDDIITYFGISHNKFETVMSLIYEYLGIDLSNYVFKIDKKKEFLIGTIKKVNLVLFFTIISERFYQTHIQKVSIEKY